jgi:hypothetical protein
MELDDYACHAREMRQALESAVAARSSCPHKRVTQTRAMQGLAAAHLCFCWWASCLIVGFMQPADELGQQLVERDAR